MLGMKCANHPEEAATEVCVSCSKRFCDDCVVHVGASVVCAACNPGQRVPSRLAKVLAAVVMVGAATTFLSLLQERQHRDFDAYEYLYFVALGSFLVAFALWLWSRRRAWVFVASVLAIAASVGLGQMLKFKVDPEVVVGAAVVVMAGWNYFVWPDKK